MVSRSISIAGYHFVADEYSSEFILLRSEECPDLPLLAQSIYQKNFPFIRDIIGTEKEICLMLNGDLNKDILEELDGLEYGVQSQQNIYHLPVWFSDGKDWHEVRSHSRLSKQEFIDQIEGLTLRLSMYGFLPGFLYLSGIPEHLCLPRKSTPSVQVPEGSIGVGGKYIGVYNYSSPGGWHVIGATPISTFNLQSDKVEALAIGSEIKFKAITEDQYKVLKVMDQSLLEYNS